MVKQRITVKELNKLTAQQKQHLQEWWKPSVFDVYIEIGHDGETETQGITSITRASQHVSEDALPLLAIGQMIELIQEMKPLKSLSKSRFDKWSVSIETATLGYKDELCDSLWETVTRIL